MFIGHFALGFAAKRAAPQTSLGTLFLAAQFVDLVWPTLLLLGVERVEIDPALSGAPLVFVHYPISHSLLGAIGWAALVGAAYFAVSRERRGAWVVALLVVSHWLLDLVVHRPDLPLLFAGGPTLGLGLWNLPVVELVLETRAVRGVLRGVPAHAGRAGRRLQAVGACSGAARHTACERLRPTASVDGGHRMGRPGAMAARGGWLLGGSTLARTPRAAGSNRGRRRSSGLGR